MLLEGGNESDREVFFMAAHTQFRIKYLNGPAITHRQPKRSNDNQVRWQKKRMKQTKIQNVESKTANLTGEALPFLQLRRSVAAVSPPPEPDRYKFSRTNSAAFVAAPR